MKKILSLDGGGARGVIQMAALDELEKATGEKCVDMFDLIIGTSVGSINATLLSTGRYTAGELLGVMYAVLPKVFKRKFFKRGAKYSKKALRDAYYNLLGPDACLGDAKVKTIVTSWEDTEGCMHFFKSWEEKDSLMSMFSAVDRSSAAPLFFGPVVDDENNRVWLDGGVGIFNNPALYAYGEHIRQGWGDTTCYSLGCGWTSHSRSFKDASKKSKLSQILNFVRPADGGIARDEAPFAVCDFLEGIDIDKKWTFSRIDREIAKKLDGMDKIKYIKEYERIGRDMGKDLVEEYCNG